MASYAQFGYGEYPSESQLLSGAVQTNTASASMPSNATSASTDLIAVTGTASSPLSAGANEASLSPSGGSTTTGVTTTGPLSPGATSQASNHAGTMPGSMAGTIAPGLGFGESHPNGTGSVGISVNDAAGALVNSNGGTSCCENGRPITTDPVSGQTVCSCQYDSARLALSSYSRMPATSVGVYGTPYPSNDQNPYPSIGVDSSAFYAPLSNPYTLKDSGNASEMTAWTSAGLQTTTGYYSYDPTLAPYGYGASYDLAARRKNATRESTATLKAWLNEHKKNPYPTKGEKIMLAIITKMTLTQVSTWFANARRRLKKENKMTWEPKNKTGDDDDAMLSGDEKDKDAAEAKEPGNVYGTSTATTGEHHKDLQHIKSEDQGKHDMDEELQDLEHKAAQLLPIRAQTGASNASYTQRSTYNSYPQQQQSQQHQQLQQHASGFYHHSGQQGVYMGSQQEHVYSASKNPLSRDCGIQIPATKPKIWSLADTVACKTPPPPSSVVSATSYLSAPPPSTHLPQLSQQQHQEHQYYHQHQTHLLQQQQQQQKQQLLPTYYNTPDNILTQHQQQQLTPLTPTQLQPAHNSLLNTMSSYVGASQYSRALTEFTAISNNKSNRDNSTNNNITSPITPTTPPIASHAHQQPQQHQTHQTHSYHHQPPQCQPPNKRLGFLEIQPDTPPQTPPNMKLIHNSSSTLLNLQITSPAPAATSTIGMCYNNASANIFNVVGYGNNLSSPNNFLASLTTARAEA